MNRNSNYIITKIKDPTGHAQKAQVGVDITVGKIELVSGIAVFDENSKLNRDLINYTEAPTCKEYLEKNKNALIDHKYKEVMEANPDAYYIEPNTHFLVEFEQGISLANDEWGYIIHRSSLNRVCTFASSAVWDPKFFTDVMGTTYHSGSVPLIIPKGTRIGQFLIFDSEYLSDEEGYHGQWQNVANH